jgi:hypothetical protein
VVGASAALTGLVFVAMSLNPGVIALDATYRHRAVGTLSGFTAIFVICALGVMGGQDHRAVGLGWFVVAALAAFVYVYGYIQLFASVEARRAFGLSALSAARHFTPSKLSGRPVACRVHRWSVSGGDFNGRPARLDDLRGLVAHHGGLRTTVDRPGPAMRLTTDDTWVGDTRGVLRD